jgi:hypothetical protein
VTGLEILAFPSRWFVAIAVVVSLYQAFRGWYFQARMLDPKAARAERVAFHVTRSLADAIWYGVTTLGGFAALLVAYRMLAAGAGALTGPSAALLVFLLIVAGVGVTGHLPDVMIDFEALRRRLGPKL